MTDSNFDFNSLFKPIEEVDIKNEDIFKKASLIFYVDIEKDLNGFEEDKIELFKEHAYERMDGTYGLKKELRLDILSNSIGVNNLLNAIEEYQVESRFSNVIKMLCNAETLNIQELNNVQLYYLMVLSSLFEDKVKDLNLNSVYQRRQFLKPFESITDGFTGREEVLTRISDYVDWMPKSSTLKSIKSSILNFLDWNEKPPLLIKGIGGTGKSTIVSKFILEQNQERHGKRLPFIYVDFDLPGFSITEPMTILVESLRQVAIQFPDHEELIDQVSERISEMIFNGKKQNNSSSQVRQIIYKKIRSEFGSQLEGLGNRPILAVFDSFEEMQYRATSEELNNFFSFLKEISELIPRLRPIFAGRSEIAESLDGIKFDEITIEGFDAKSALSFLEKKGIEQPDIRTQIFDNFGGNPLMLSLAIDLAKKSEINPEENVHGTKWEYLVNRILGHIHSDQVRKVAVPGMLVRSVTPEVIQHVLAGPTGLGEITKNEATTIFNELKKEVALISKSADSQQFSFRQDLRMICENMILTQYPDASRQIRKNAILYYASYKEMKSGRKRDEFEAEYYFHMLKDGFTPHELDNEKYLKLRPLIERSIIELPEKATIFLNTLSNRKVAKEKIRNTANDGWENYLLGLIKESLNGELRSLEEHFDELKNRRHRINDGFTSFGFYECLLYQRLNRIGPSNKKIEKALDWSRWNHGKVNKNLELEFRLLKLQNYEYEERYREAIEYCSYIEKDVHRKDIDQLLRMKFDFLQFRVNNRFQPFKAGEGKNLNASDVHLLFDMKKSRFNDTKWRFLFDLKINPFSVQPRPDGELNDIYRMLRRELRNLENLEEYAYSKTDFFLKDITYTGHFKVVLRDFVFVMEIINHDKTYRDFF